MEEWHKQNAQNVNFLTKNTPKSYEKNLEFNAAHSPKDQRLRQHLHGLDPFGTSMKLIWVSFMLEHMGPSGSGMDQICSLVPNGSTYEGDPIRNHTVQV